MRARYPDKSDAEAMIMGKRTVLNEDADITLNGVFASCREMLENICERLVKIWEERRQNPALLEQPIAQWRAISKRCKFAGYKPQSEPIQADEIMSSGVLLRRMISASLDDAQRGMWVNSKWNQ